MTRRYRYLREPEAIYRRSFEMIRAEAELGRLPADIAAVAVRLIHACGMADIVDDLAFSADAVAAGRSALLAGAPVLADSRMVASGVVGRRLPAGNAVICSLDDVGDVGRATTRSAAAVELWGGRLADAVVAIGNAPTALFRLLELMAGGAPRPAVIFGFPVGFVGAAEAKDALAADDHGVPFLTLRGRRGGSALAAAAVNAVAAASE